MLFIGVFKIDVNNLEWIGEQKDDPEDLCLHGNVKVQIGETTFETVGTVSATALYLLKTLTQDTINRNFTMSIQFRPFTLC